MGHAHPISPLIVLATAWAGLVSVLGLAAVFGGEGSPPLPPAACMWLGIAGAAGGQFIFMVLAADRWFQRASRALVRTAEGLTLLVLAGAAALAVYLIRTGASG